MNTWLHSRQRLQGVSRKVAMSLAVVGVFGMVGLAVTQPASAQRPRNGQSFYASENPVQLSSTGAPSSVTLTITSSSSREFRLGNDWITGVKADKWSIQDDNCLYAYMKPGGTCTLQLTFTPGKSQYGQAQKAWLVMHLSGFGRERFQLLGTREKS